MCRTNTLILCISCGKYKPVRKFNLDWRGSYAICKDCQKKIAKKITIESTQERRCGDVNKC